RRTFPEPKMDTPAAPFNKRLCRAPLVYRREASVTERARSMKTATTDRKSHLGGDRARHPVSFIFAARKAQVLLGASKGWPGCWPRLQPALPLPSRVPPN